MHSLTPSSTISHITDCISGSRESFACADVLDDPDLSCSEPDCCSSSSEEYSELPDPELWSLSVPQSDSDPDS